MKFHRVIVLILFIIQGFKTKSANSKKIESVQCHPYGNLKFVRSVYRLKTGHKTVNVDVGSISPLWKDIGTNLKRASLIVNKYVNSDDDQKPPDPIYSNPRFSVYLLKDKYTLRRSASACAYYNLKNFVPHVGRHANTIPNIPN